MSDVTRTAFAYLWLRPPDQPPDVVDVAQQYQDAGHSPEHGFNVGLLASEGQAQQRHPPPTAP